MNDNSIFIDSKKNIVQKIFKKNQSIEIQIWKDKLMNLPLGDHFILPGIIQSNNNRIILQMSLCKQSAYDLFQKKDQYALEKKMIHDIQKALLFLNKNGIVHGDIHFKNILFDNNHFYLIDFGLAKHLDYLQNIYDKQLYELYIWSKEDIFRLITLVVFRKNQRLCIKNNNYKNIRKKWVDWFTKHSQDWIFMKQHLYKSFDFSNKIDFSYCLGYFFSKILTTSKRLSPKNGIYQYDILTKLFLERLFLYTSVFFPEIIGLDLSKKKQNLYIRVIQNISIQNDNKNNKNNLYQS